MADGDPTRLDPAGAPAAAVQDWTRVMADAQRAMLEQGLAMTRAAGASNPGTDAAVAWWRESAALWQRMLDPAFLSEPEDPGRARDKRFKDAAWRDEPVWNWVRRSYLALSDHLMEQVERADGLDERARERLRFAARGFADAMSPSNFALTNPEVMRRTAETGGENLVKGLGNLMRDASRGQMTHTDAGAFELGRNLATTPGKVVLRTELFELIQYSPTTDTVLQTPLVIFPPWINRFYILDLTPEKSFIRWAVSQGITVFMVSWKSADASMKDVAWDDYVRAQVRAVGAVRDLLAVPAVHTVGYCVAGTTLAATLAWLAAKGRADEVASATFFTAQVDFSEAGDLLHFVDDEQLRVLEQLSPDGFLDGRYMAATFNSLRGRDLIWNYVTANYLLGEDYAPFDLLHWNGDTTNLPAKWHMSYLTDLYRDNLLVEPGRLSVDGKKIDLTRVETPAYIQAGREDHIAPAESVWKVTRLFRGPVRFVLAGSGHIAGVVNPPSANKYQYWVNEGEGVETLERFRDDATETKGSWWPDWAAWLRGRAPLEVPADGARVPGAGTLPALGDAPGNYVRER